MHREGLDRVLAARPDLEPVLVRVLADADGEPGDVLRRLQASDEDGFAALTLAVTGAYYTDPAVRRLIGYPGQQYQPELVDACARLGRGRTRPRRRAGRDLPQHAHIGRWRPFGARRDASGRRGYGGGACGWLAVIARPACVCEGGLLGVAARADVVIVEQLVVSGAEQDEVVELGRAAALDRYEVVCFELASGGAAGVLAVG